MRTPLQIPAYLVKEAQLYAPSRDALDAVCHVLADYPRLVADVRRMRSRLAQLDAESADFDARLADLQVACRHILDLWAGTIIRPGEILQEGEKVPFLVSCWYHSSHLVVIELG